MREIIEEYRAVFCIFYIPWIIFGVASGMCLFVYNYYTLWAFLFLGVIYLVRFIYCKRKAPKILITVYNDAVKVNFEKNSEMVDISNIKHVHKRWNSVVIKKKDEKNINISTFLFSDSSDIKSFVSITNNLIDDYELKHK